MSTQKIKYLIILCLLFVSNILPVKADTLDFERPGTIELTLKESTEETPIKDLEITIIEIASATSENYNLVFMISTKNGVISDIMVTIPQDRINFATLNKQPVFMDEDFITSKTFVEIKVGSTKVSLDELKNLAKDDIVILENSESSKLILISGNLETKFNVKPDSSLILNVDNDDTDDENIYEEVTMEKNLWDDIQIEVSAEFDKVKMTIGELKQITQGQIVDLGSVFNNEIFLYVEDKKVAKGELMIINDRYAVRLNEILNVNENISFLNPKAILQEYTQSIDKKLPNYILIKEEGKEHDKTFYVEVEYQNQIIGKGNAKSIKQAQINAAYNAILELGLVKTEEQCKQ